MSYILNFTLKQYTPILHFQHTQAGATLRASEVKPKFDLFLMEKTCVPFKGATAKKTFLERHPDWLVGGKGTEHITLDYKISFDCSESSEWLILNNISEKYLTDIQKEDKNANHILLSSPYFANNQYFDQREVQNSKWQEMRRGLLSKSPVKGKIVCLVPGLMEIIEANLRLFFAAHNFGTRQSKGFGSFSVEKINAVPVQDSETEFIKESILEAPEVIAAYFFETKMDIKGKLKKVTEAWKNLKAGDSFKKYEKSSLMKYYCSSSIRWEKRAIKKAIKSKSNGVWKKLKYDVKSSDTNFISGCKNDDEGEKYQYIRALMGLAEHNEYGTFNSRDSIKILIRDKASNNEATKYLAADRFKSPITFKITADAIFMFVHSIPELLSKDLNENNREFEFVLSGKIDGVDIPQVILDTLTVPKTNSLESFLDAIWLNNDLEPGERNESNAKNQGFQKILKPAK